MRSIGSHVSLAAGLAAGLALGSAAVVTQALIPIVHWVLLIAPLGICARVPRLGAIRFLPAVRASVVAAAEGEALE